MEDFLVFFSLFCHHMIVKLNKEKRFKKKKIDKNETGTNLNCKI